MIMRTIVADHYMTMTNKNQPLLTILLLKQQYNRDAWILCLNRLILFLTMVLIWYEYILLLKLISTLYFPNIILTSQHTSYGTMSITALVMFCL